MPLKPGRYVVLLLVSWGAAQTPCLVATVEASGWVEAGGKRFPRASGLHRALHEHQWTITEWMEDDLGAVVSSEGEPQEPYRLTVLRELPTAPPPKPTSSRTARGR